MNLEERLRESLKAADDRQPSPDFAERVMGAIPPRSGSMRPRLWLMAAAVFVAIGLLGSSFVLSRPVLVPSSPSRQTPNVATSPSSPSEVPAAASSSPSLSPDEIALPTRAPHDPGGGDALLTGVLGGTARNGGWCIWVEAADGYEYSTAVTRASIIWPFGFHAFVNPLRVVGPDGQVLAKVGDTIELGGGGPPQDYVPTPAQDPCALGQIFSISSVGSVNGIAIGIGEGSLKLVTRSPGSSVACPSTFLEPVMLVMGDERLQLRILSSGRDLNVTWPPGFTARPGNRISVIDDNGMVVMTQGVEVSNARGTATDNQIEFCGLGEASYR